MLSVGANDFENQMTTETDVFTVLKHFCIFGGMDTTFASLEVDFSRRVKFFVKTRTFKAGSIGPLIY